MCDPVGETECVPAFTHESERGPFVREVEKRDEKRLGDKIYGGNFAGFSHLLITIPFYGSFVALITVLFVGTGG